MNETSFAFPLASEYNQQIEYKIIFNKKGRYSQTCEFILSRKINTKYIITRKKKLWKANFKMHTMWRVPRRYYYYRINHIAHINI